MVIAVTQCPVLLEPLTLLSLVLSSFILLPGWSIVVVKWDDDEDEEDFDDCNDIGATDSAVPCALLLHLASRLIQIQI